MKKILYSLIVVCMFFTACKKDRKTPQGGTQKVTFNINFSQTTGEFEANSISNKLKVNSADTSVTNHIGAIYYVVFKTDGTQVHATKQLATEAGFGSYTDNLEVGTYTVAIAAGDKDLVINAGASLAATKMFSNSSRTTGNMYFKKFQLTVVEGSNPSQSVVLKRAMSKIILKTKDLIPSGATYAKILLRTVSNEYSFSKERGAELDGQASNKEIGSYVGAPANKPPLTTGVPLQIDLFFIYYAPFTIEVEVGRKTTLNGTPSPVYVKKTITGVVGASNALITVTGNLFGGTGTGTNAFKVAIDSTWNAPINQNF